MPARTTKNPHPINLPAIVILAILVLGLAVSIKLVDIQQLFNPKAAEVGVSFSGDGVTTSNGTTYTKNPTVKVTLTSPYSVSTSDPQSKAEPIFTDNMENSNSKLLPLTSDDKDRKGNFNDYSSYQNGTYELLVTPGGGGPLSSSGIYRQDSRNEFTAVFDAKLSGEGLGLRRTGVTFGSQKEFCDRGSQDCYRFYPWQNNGKVALFYQLDDKSGKLIFEDVSKVSLKEGDWYTFRVDRRLDQVKAWVKLNGWQQVADIPLESNKGKGKRIGFAISRADENNFDYTARGNFDNLKVYKLGDLPEPTSNGFYRYTGDSQSIEADPKGEKVQWQAMGSNPTTFNQTFSSEAGVKYFFAQFKDANGNVSKIYGAKITLQNGTGTYTACGRTGTLYSGYEPQTTCAAGTYLIVEGASDALTNTCRAVPTGYKQDPNDVCKIVEDSSQKAGNVCLSKGYSCGASNGYTRSGKKCATYWGAYDSGCKGDSVYPYCWSECQ